MYFDGNFNENFDGNFDGNLDATFMGILMMDSMGWPYDSFDCLLFKPTEPFKVRGN